MPKPGFYIRRSDGLFYAGTENHRAWFGAEHLAASFPIKEDAAIRIRGLRKHEKEGRTFKVVPADA